MDCRGGLFHYIVAGQVRASARPAFEGTIAVFARFSRPEDA
jgi:hypothetical protein